MRHNNLSVLPQASDPVDGGRIRPVSIQMWVLYGNAPSVPETLHLVQDTDIVGTQSQREHEHPGEATRGESVLSAVDLKTTLSIHEAREPHSERVSAVRRDRNAHVFVEPQLHLARLRPTVLPAAFALGS